MITLNLSRLRLSAKRLETTNLPQGQNFRIRCPVHKSKQNSLSITLTQTGRVLWFCHAGCSADNIKSALLSDGILEEVKTGYSNMQNSVQPTIKENNYYKKLWDDTIHLDESDCALYYFRDRGIPLTGYQLDHFTNHLRWCAASNSIVAKVSDLNGEIKGVHCTKIDIHTRKVLKRRCHGSMKGHAIHLSPLSPLIAIAEGIETSLSFSKIHDTPTWSCISAIGIQNFIPPIYTLIRVAADFDGASIKAFEAFKRGNPGCCMSTPDLPNHFGNDWNDQIMEL